jgi:hypothetical protein
LWVSANRIRIACRDGNGARGIPAADAERYRLAKMTGLPAAKYSA